MTDYASPWRLRMTNDVHDFEGSDGRKVSVDGWVLEDESGEIVYLDENEPVDDSGRIFYFRVAGVVHHQRWAQGPTCAPLARVTLDPEPENPVDPNAIAVHRSDGQLVGYVPRTLAPTIAILVAQENRFRLETIKSVPGAIIRTYADERGSRNAIEVLAGVNREVDLTRKVAE